MTDTTEEESDLIAKMQEDVAKVKAILERIEENAERVGHINHQAGRLIQSGDAMIWQGAIGAARSNIIAAHGVASKALVRGYDNGGAIVTAGPIR